MLVAATLPPYGHLNQEAVTCVAQASVRYEVPELLLHSIILKEGGQTGRYSTNKDGSYDLGLAQINTSWLGYFAKYGVKPEDIMNQACTNVAVSAYILKYNWLHQGQDWFKAIVAYHIGNNQWTATRYKRGYGYASDVVKNWWGFYRYVQYNATVQQPPVVSLNQK